MKNVLYISDLNLDNPSGVNKKILGEIKAFRELNMNVYYMAIKDNTICCFQNDDLKKIEKVKKNKILKKMQIINKYIDFLKAKMDIDMIYARYLFSTPQTIKLFKIAKKKKIKIIEEIPTYPYDDEIKNNKRMDLKLALMVDNFFRRKLKKYLTGIATFSDDDEIFDIPTVKIDNGIDLENNLPIDIQYKDNNIQMIAVAVMEYWQGYDRIIKSLGNYYKSKNEEEPEITIHLVGDGSEIEKLEQLTKKMEVEEKVIFHGFLSGKELDDIYNQCQCAIAGLGIFRKNISTIRPLKIREYMAKSIPFVYATTDKSIINFKYGYKVSDDEEIFDMRDIIKFLNSLDRKLIKTEMREFAERNYPWKSQMKKVIDFVNNN